MTVRVTNAGPDADTIHVLPTAWFRNTWSWDDDRDPLRELRAGTASALEIDHPLFGELELLAGDGPDGVAPRLLFCDNETNVGRLYGDDRAAAPSRRTASTTTSSTGADTRQPGARPAPRRRAGTEAVVEPGATVELRLRLRPRGASPKSTAVGARHELRQGDGGPGARGRRVLRRAHARRRHRPTRRWSCARPSPGCCGRSSSSTTTWPAGSTATRPSPRPPRRGSPGRNSRWRNFDAFDIMSMPDKWEYPWFAAWDLAFHCVALAHVDPAFAKYQLILICREWFQHPNGALPAYEWSFDDVNPPVQAWAALEVFAIDGARRRRLPPPGLRQAAGQLHLVGQPRGRRRLQPVRGRLPRPRQHRPDRPRPPPGGRDAAAVRRHRVDGALLAAHGHDGLGAGPPRPADPGPDRQVPRALRADPEGARRPGPVGRGRRLLLRPHRAGRRRPGARQGAVDGRGAAGARQRASSTRCSSSGPRRSARASPPCSAAPASTSAPWPTRAWSGASPASASCCSASSAVDKVGRLFDRLFAEDEFLSPYGMRAVSQAHRDQPYELEIGELRASIDYEPAESTTDMFGGNSNWRGPIWFPLNYLLVSSIKVYGTFFGESLTVEYPTGSGQQRSLDEIADDLRTPAHLALPGGRRRAAPLLRRGRPCSSTTPGGGTTSSSTSTSTATTAPAWAPPIRPAGPGSSPTSSADRPARTSRR